MPKISPERLQERRERVESAALQLFRARGFHGVGLREIAAEAGVSLGNIYNHYEGKEAIFDSLVLRLHADFTALRTPLARYLAKSRFPHDLPALGRAIGRMLREHSDYLTLIHIDIAEFDGRHVRPFYEGLAATFAEALEARVDPEDLAPGLSIEVAFTMAYMQFFNFFIVERMIGARRHLGLSERDAVAALAGVLERGLRRSA